MNLLGSFLSTLILAVRRLWNHRLLMLCLLLGLVAAVGLLSSIPLYADSVHHRLLQGELTDAGAYRPPFAFLWHYVGTWNGDLAWEEYSPADQYLSQQLEGVVGMPLAFQVRHVKSQNLRLFAASDSQAFQDREPLLWTTIGFISSLQEHIELVEGEFPRAGAPSDDVEVLVSQSLATRMGLQAGERYVLFGSGAGSDQIPVRVAGTWQPIDVTSPFWFYQPVSFDDVLLTAEPAFEAQVATVLKTPVSLAVWYQVFDGTRVQSTDVPRLLTQIAQAESRTTALLPHTELYSSPAKALEQYSRSAHLLTVVLSAFSIPLLGLLLYFVALIAGMVVRRGQAEIAVLRSRGTTRAQILLVHLLEGLVVAAGGLTGGLLLGGWLARIMGRSRTFLDPNLLIGVTDSSSPITVSLTALRYGFLAVGLALLALLIPALIASRHTIVTFRWERARALLRPFWQRYFLDFLLLTLPLYGWYQLRQQGAIALVGRGDDPFSNPLLFLVPALFCFSLALLFVRVFPLLMRALAWVAGLLPGTILLLTWRQLARSAGLYSGPLLLLSLTLSLATFTASMAVTLDGHLVDQAYYQTGADLRLAEQGQSTEKPEQRNAVGQPTPSPSSDEDEEGPRWLFLPVGVHLKVPGVAAAARVGNYNVTSNIGNRQETGRLLGVDRIDFPWVAFFRPDFAGGEPVAGLMNRLAVNRSNILVSRQFLASHSLSVGDPLRLTMGIAGEYQEIEFLVAGPLDLFPTLYPQDGPFFVANLEYVYEGMGGTFPYDVWLATDAEVPGNSIVKDVSGLGLSVISAADARATIVAEQTRPERQGLFGLLSVGFVAAAALTVLGFLVYSVVSFQQRFIELGMLRAVGLSVGQMVGNLACEQAMLILSGGILGTALGVAASRLFIPYMQVGADKFARIPPFVVQIAWGELWSIYAVFGAMFIVAVSVLVALLVRMKVFEAIKLGEVG